MCGGIATMGSALSAGENISCCIGGKGAFIKRGGHERDGECVLVERSVEGLGGNYSYNK